MMNISSSIAGALAAGLRPDQVAISNRLNGGQAMELEDLYRKLMMGAGFGGGMPMAGPMEKPAEPAKSGGSMSFPDTAGYVPSKETKTAEFDSALKMLGEDKTKQPGDRDPELMEIMDKVRSGRGVLTDRDRAILAATLGPVGAANVQNSVRTQRKMNEAKPRGISSNKERLAKQRMRRAEERPDLSEQERERLKKSAEKLLAEAGDIRKKNNLTY